MYFAQDQTTELVLHQAFVLVALLGLQTPQTIGKLMDMSIARRKCLCVSGKVVLLSKHFDIVIVVPMAHSKLWNYRYLYKNYIKVDWNEI